MSHGAIGLVGNDVIDLRHPANACAHERPRLVSRVLGDGEREALRNCCEPTAMLWSFFAAKEAAYKLLCKLGPRPVFAHRRFIVDPSLTSVSHDQHLLPLRVDRDQDRVHAVVSTAGIAPMAVVDMARPQDDPTTAVRRLLSTRLARHFGCSAAMLAVVRDPNTDAWDDLGPPRLLRYGIPVKADVSLSHDGRFVAFAACV